MYIQITINTDPTANKSIDSLESMAEYAIAESCKWDTRKIEKLPIYNRCIYNLKNNNFLVFNDLRERANSLQRKKIQPVFKDSNILVVRPEVFTEGPGALVSTIDYSKDDNNPITSFLTATLAQRLYTYALIKNIDAQVQATAVSFVIQQYNISAKNPTTSSRLIAFLEILIKLFKTNSSKTTTDVKFTTNEELDILKKLILSIKNNTDTSIICHDTEYDKIINTPMVKLATLGKNILRLQYYSYIENNFFNYALSMITMLRDSKEEYPNIQAIRSNEKQININEMCKTWENEFLNGIQPCELQESLTQEQFEKIIENIKNT